MPLACQVVELQMQLDAKQEELKAINKATKRDKMTKIANEARSCSLSVHHLV